MKLIFLWCWKWFLWCRWDFFLLPFYPLQTWREFIGVETVASDYGKQLSSQPHMKLQQQMFHQGEVGRCDSSDKYKLSFTHLVFFHKIDKLSSFDLYWLTRSVVQGNYEVEKVGLSQVAGRLLLEMSPAQLRTARKQTTPLRLRSSWMSDQRPVISA